MPFSKKKRVSNKETPRLGFQAVSTRTALKMIPKRSILISPSTKLAEAASLIGISGLMKAME